MPPKLSRKRTRPDTPELNTEPPPKRVRAHNPATRRTKESVFQTLDAPPKAKRTLSQTKAFLEQEDDSSELSDPETSEDDFEDVPLNGAGPSASKSKTQGKSEGEESEDDDWEDALGAHHHTKPDHGPAPVISGDIALTLSAAPKTAFDTKPDGKKGPSKVQRQIRNVSHCMHVQCLMYHNLMRNAWIQDKVVQKTLVENMSAGCWRELERYWRDAGISDGPSRVVASDPRAAKTPKKDTKDTKTMKSAKTAKGAKETPKSKGKWKETGKNGVKVYESPQTKRTNTRDEKPKAAKGKEKDARNGDRKGRDWGATSEPLEPNTPNLSAGDPLLRLLKYLSAYWKSRFQVTAPSLRKRGYLSPSTLEAEINAWREDPNHPDTFGERVENLDAFRDLARKCEGSRDVGQQLFTALVRGLGVEARMVVSLQPVGFGWSQSEEGKPKNLEKLKDVAKTVQVDVVEKSTPVKSKGKQPVQAKRKGHSSDIEMHDSSDLSSVISISSDTDEDRPVKKSTKSRNYGEELPYPTYWTEAISHLTYTPISVSPLPRTIIASAAAPEKLVEFYARGAAADKSRQVLAYLVAFSSDGTAKDVTTRYLPKHQWPGRTKGFRMPIERIPIHNKRGKVKRWEEWNWVELLLQPYARLHSQRQPWDEVEDEGDLVPAKPEKKKEMDEEGGKETLQGYKNSSEYVLERHLRREEALKPGAKIVRHFITGKGENEKSEPVYRRKDIVNCKTVESWHKDGREIKTGEQPLKFVKHRAVTVTRKREIEERERVEGGKVQQGLYAKSQTDWIIPDPIIDGKIPRNAFGSIDIYVPTMIPRGSVHIPLKGTARICRKLNIDYAEACTGFEFGKQRAVPVLTGVVVAEENEDMVIDAWEIEATEKARKEAEKREKLVLGLWKKFASGLRIVERMKAEYGDDVVLPAKKANATLKAESEPSKSEWEVFQNHTDFKGGFMRDDGPPAAGGFIPETKHQDVQEDMAGGFSTASQDDPEHGDLTIDHGEQGKEEDTRTALAENTYRTPISLTSALLQPASTPGDLSETEPTENNSNNPDPSDVETNTIPQPPSRRAKSSARKSLIIDDSSSDLDLSDAPSRPATPPPAKKRAPPKRTAARKSEEQVKSHFFAESGEDTDRADMTGRMSVSPKKRGGKAGGARGGRGRGRGRVRGKGQGKG